MEIMVAMTYFVILESLLPIEINVDCSHGQNKLCNHLVVQQFSTTNFSSSSSVDSWSKFLSGNHRERKLLTKSNFSGPSSLSFGSSILLLSLMKWSFINEINVCYRPPRWKHWFLGSLWNLYLKYKIWLWNYDSGWYKCQFFLNRTVAYLRTIKAFLTCSTIVKEFNSHRYQYYSDWSYQL